MYIIKENFILRYDLQVHYYQPIFTLIGAGESTLETAKRQMSSVLPKKAKWLQSVVTAFKPNENQIETESGEVIEYELMIIAVGLQLYWDEVCI